MRHDGRRWQAGVDVGQAGHGDCRRLAVAEIGDKATGISCDVANLNDPDRLYEAVKKYGRKRPDF